MELSLRLKTLHLDYYDRDEVSYSTVTKFISKHKSSVTNMNLYTQKPSFPIFPPLGNIVIFPLLSRLFLCITSISTNNLEFLSLTPNLRSLTVYDSSFSVTRPAQQEKRLFSNTITTLHPILSLVSLIIAPDILTSDCPRRIAKWFPNLHRFSATLDDNLLCACLWTIAKHSRILHWRHPYHRFRDHRGIWECYYFTHSANFWATAFKTEEVFSKPHYWVHCGYRANEKYGHLCTKPNYFLLPFCNFVNLFIYFYEFNIELQRLTITRAIVPGGPVTVLCASYWRFRLWRTNSFERITVSTHGQNNGEFLLCVVKIQECGRCFFSVFVSCVYLVPDH